MYSNKRWKEGGFPGWFSGWDSALPLQEAGLPSLVQELRSCMPSHVVKCGHKKKKKKERKKERSSRFTIRKTKLFIINKIHLNTKHPCGGEFPNQKGPSDCQGDVYRSPGTLEELMMITETVRSKRLNRS